MAQMILTTSVLCLHQWRSSSSNLTVIVNVTTIATNIIAIQVGSYWLAVSMYIEHICQQFGVLPYSCLLLPYPCSIQQEKPAKETTTL